MYQPMIARPFEDDSYIAMASLDLSVAFDIVDMKLLIKRLPKITKEFNQSHRTKNLTKPDGFLKSVLFYKVLCVPNNLRNKYI